MYTLATLVLVAAVQIVRCDPIPEADAEPGYINYQNNFGMNPLSVSSIYDSVITQFPFFTACECTLTELNAPIVQLQQISMRTSVQICFVYIFYMLARQQGLSVENALSVANEAAEIVQREKFIRQIDDFIPYSNVDCQCIFNFDPNMIYNTLGKRSPVSMTDFVSDPLFLSSYYNMKSLITNSLPTLMPDSLQHLQNVISSLLPDPSNLVYSINTSISSLLNFAQNARMQLPSLPSLPPYQNMIPKIPIVQY